jgi:succinate-acetate transporter protein
MNFSFNDFLLFFILCLSSVKESVKVVFPGDINGIFTSCIALPTVPELKEVFKTNIVLEMN